MDDISKSITERFAIIVDRLFDTQNDAAKQFGFTRSYLSAIYNGKKPITAHVIEAICRCVPMVNIDWLYHGRGVMVSEIKNDDDDGIAKTNEPLLIYPMPSGNAKMIKDSLILEGLAQLLDDVEGLKAWQSEMLRWQKEVITEVIEKRDKKKNEV